VSSDTFAQEVRCKAYLEAHSAGWMAVLVSDTDVVWSLRSEAMEVLNKVVDKRPGVVRVKDIVEVENLGIAAVVVLLVVVQVNGIVESCAVGVEHVVGVGE